MAMQWNPEILSKFIAPDIASFTSADIPDLTSGFPEAPYWLVNHFLNSAVGPSFKHQWRQVVLAYLRRSHNAFNAYHDARRKTLTYLDGNQPDNPRVGMYFDAVSRWEDFVLQVSMAIDLFRWLNNGQGAFAKNDGSKEQRLYEVANLVKHTASAVRSGQCKESDTVPLWLSNHGLHSFDVLVTYSDASQILADVSRLADDYQNPGLLREKWRKGDPP